MRFILFVFVPFVFAGAAGTAGAQDWVPSKHGADDTLGAINFLSPEKVVQAAQLVKTGQAYPLGVVTGWESPAYPPRHYAITIIQPGQDTGPSVYILENMDTRALAADRAWEFLFVLGQPRFEGAVQAIINPVAIR